MYKQNDQKLFKETLNPRLLNWNQPMKSDHINRQKEVNFNNGKGFCFFVVVGKGKSSQLSNKQKIQQNKNYEMINSSSIIQQQ